MGKKDFLRIEEAKAKWEDMISEKEAMKKLNVSARTLKRMRDGGKIKNFRFATNSRNLVYSRTELTEIFCPVI
jgi:hypothetical protein